MHRPSIVIVTPALADANNGNWQTARRWARLLAPAYRVRVCQHWTGGDEDLMLALHARRSAGSVRAWRTAHPQRPLVLALTGTDLYRDIRTDTQALESLALADRLVVLNQLGSRALPTDLRSKAQVVLQSCGARVPQPKSPRRLRGLMVGHLRPEKDPATYFEAARLLRDEPGLYLDHIGGALEPALADQARDTQAACPAYRWLGALPHNTTRGHIQRAHVLVQPSRMEGGAHTVIEAVRSGTPVLASRIDGNVGLLGEGYGGYFAPGDALALAALLRQVHHDRASLEALRAQVAACAERFAPEQERASLMRALDFSRPLRAPL